MNVLLISETKLKSFTNINKNVDIDTIRAEVKIAQDLHLQPILGTKFYNTLLGKVSLTGNTFTTDEKTLVDEYISPYLIQKSYSEIIPHIWARTMNRGIVNGQMENANSVDVNTMKYLRGLQVQRADFYKMRLKDYLTTGEGQNKFPDYLSTSSTDGMSPDKHSGYESPIVLYQSTRKGFPFKTNNIESYSEDEKLRGY